MSLKKVRASEGANKSTRQEFIMLIKMTDSIGLENSTASGLKNENKCVIP